MSTQHVFVACVVENRHGAFLSNLLHGNADSNPRVLELGRETNLLLADADTRSTEASIALQLERGSCGLFFRFTNLGLKLEYQMYPMLFDIRIVIITCMTYLLNYLHDFTHKNPATLLKVG